MAEFALWFRGPSSEVWVELWHGSLLACQRDRADREASGWRGKFQILPTSGPAPRRRFVPPTHSAGIGRNPADCATVGFSSER
jgi:hypothetical protein